MKDFAKSIVCNVKAEVEKVGNAQKDDPKARQLWEEMQHAKKLAEDWAHEINRTGDQSLKGSQKDAEEAYKKAKKAYEDYALNSKTGNKSNYRYKGFLITFSQDGIHVFLQNGYTLAFGPTGSEEKAKDWCDWHDPKTNKPVAEFRNSKVGNKKIKGNYITIDTSTGRVTFDDFAGKSFDISRIDSSAGFELRVMQQQINDFKKAIDEAKSLAKQNGLI